jgi:arsenate reductase
MAEAIINANFSDQWRAFSAGTKPTGYIHPKAIEVLSEIGIEVNGHSKHVDEFRQTAFDVVVTVCDSAEEECPVWLGSGRKLHIAFPDPAEAQGTEQEILDAFRAVRDDILHKIPEQLMESV